MTRAPKARAIWMAACPTPLPPASTEHVVAGRDPGERDQHVPRRQERQREGSGLGEGDVIRNRDQVGDRHGHVVRIAAVRQQTQDVVGGAQVVASRAAGVARAAPKTGLQHDARADRHRPSTSVRDFTGHVAAGDMRERDPQAFEPAAFPQVEMVECAGVHAHDGASRGRRGIRCLLIPDDRRRTVLMESCGFHGHPGAISETAPASRRARSAPILSRSPTMRVSRRDGSMCSAATRATSASSTASTFGTNVLK